MLYSEAVTSDIRTECNIEIKEKLNPMLEPYGKEVILCGIFSRGIKIVKS